MKKVFMIAMLLLVGIIFMGISTASACDCEGTGTPGYWKNKGAGDWGVVTEICFEGGNGNGPFAGECYTKDEALEIMNGPVRGDKSITMFKAYVAAYLNVMNGACGSGPDCEHWFYGDINLREAVNWLELYGVETNIRARTEPWQYSHGEAIYFCLDDYNNGLQPGSPSRDTTEDGTICLD